MRHRHPIPLTGWTAASIALLLLALAARWADGPGCRLAVPSLLGACALSLVVRLSRPRGRGGA